MLSQQMTCDLRKKIAGLNSTNVNENNNIMSMYQVIVPYNKAVSEDNNTAEKQKAHHIKNLQQEEKFIRKKQI